MPLTAAQQEALYYARKRRKLRAGFFNPTEGGTFTPSDVASLQGWWRGDDLTGANNDFVASWADASGNSNTATQPTFDSQPKMQTAVLDGKNALWNDPTNMGNLEVPDSMFTGVTAGTLVLLAKRVVDVPTIESEAGPVADFGGATDDTLGEHYPWTDGNIYSSFGSNARFSMLRGGDLSQWHMAGFVSQTNDWRYYHNAALSHSEAVVTVNWHTTFNFIATAHSGAFSVPYWFPGHIAEILFFAEALGQSDRQKVEGYLAHKWGLEGSLPVEHPYKSVAP